MILWKEGVWMDTFLMMFSVRELIIAAAVLVVIIIALIISRIVSSRRKNKELRELDREAEMYCNMWYARLVKEADAKYAAYLKRGYQDRLPAVVEAIDRENELQDLMDQAESQKQERAILEEHVPAIIFPLVRARNEGLENISKKEAAQLKQLMQEYGVI